MANELAIPYYAVEMTQAVVQTREEEADRETVLGFFPPMMHLGEKISVPRLHRDRHVPRQTTRDGKGYSIPSGTLNVDEYEPGFIKPSFDFVSGDVDRFMRADMAGQGQSPESRAMLESADRLIARKSEDIADDYIEWKIKIATLALQGTGTVKVGEATKTIDFGLTALTAPSTKWDNAAATVLKNLRAAYNEFRDNNASNTDPDTIFYHPSLFTDYLSLNTELVTLSKTDPFVRDFLQLAMLPTGDIKGREVSLIPGVRWVPVPGSHILPGDTSATARWDYKKLVFANTRRCGAEWAHSFSAAYQPQVGLHLEVMPPRMGAAVKNWTVQGFSNGIARYERPDLVQTLQVIT